MKVLYLPVHSIRFERDHFGVSKPIIPDDIFDRNPEGWIFQDDDGNFFALGLPVLCGKLLVVHSEDEYVVFLDCNKVVFSGGFPVVTNDKLLSNDTDCPIGKGHYSSGSLFQLVKIDDCYFSTVIDLIACLGQTVLSAFKCNGESYSFHRATFQKAMREYIFARGL